MKGYVKEQRWFKNKGYRAFCQDIAGLVLRVACYVLRVTGCGLRVACYGLRVTCYGLRVTCYGLRVKGYGLRVTGYGLPSYALRACDFAKASTGQVAGQACH